MPIQTIQKLIWDTIQLLRQFDLMTNKEAVGICLVRFTWSPEEAEARLAELQGRLAAGRQQN